MQVEGGVEGHPVTHDYPSKDGIDHHGRPTNCSGGIGGNLVVECVQPELTFRTIWQRDIGVVAIRRLVFTRCTRLLGGSLVARFVVSVIVRMRLQL